MGAFEDTCRASGCARGPHADFHGYCVRHFSRDRRRPLSLRPSAMERFIVRLGFSDRTYDGTRCLEWQGSITRGGYGSFSIARDRSVVTHRWLYEQWVGPIPEGLHLDHLCKNRACCNVLHLEPVTPRENVLRAQGTHCIRGHEFTADNLIHSKHGHRICKACRLAYDRARRAAKRAAVAA